jgi:predicted nucleotidyltransferase
MLFHTVDHVLGTQAKVRLLRALAQLDSPVSGREAQRLAGVRSMSGAGRALSDLADLGILVRHETGGTHLYRMNRDHLLAEPLTGLFQAEERQLASLRVILGARLEAAGLAGVVRSVVIFGSAVRGDARPGSDLDLLAVVEGEEAVGAVRNALLDADTELRRRLGVRASPYVLSRERLEARTRAGDPLMASIRAEGRTLLGAAFDEETPEW